MMEKYKEIERSIIKTYRKPIWKKFVSGINKYEMINEGDRIAVCISGGKASMLMAKLVEEIYRHGVKLFEAEYIALDTGSPEWRQRLTDNAAILNIPLHILDGSSGESLYAEAHRLGCNKIALGHHFDDVIENILMNMLYGARIETLLPKQRIGSHAGMELIRPMYMIKEKDINAWARHAGLELCGAADAAEPKGQEMKELIKKFRKTNQYIDINIFNSVQNVNLSTIIGWHDGDREYNFLDDYDERKITSTSETFPSA